MDSHVKEPKIIFKPYTLVKKLFPKRNKRENTYDVFQPMIILYQLGHGYFFVFADATQVIQIIPVNGVTAEINKESCDQYD